MNAIEIEQAVSELFSQPYDAAEFPYQFLEAFGNKAPPTPKTESITCLPPTAYKSTLPIYKAANR